MIRVAYDLEYEGTLITFSQVNEELNLKETVFLIFLMISRSCNCFVLLMYVKNELLLSNNRSVLMNTLTKVTKKKVVE